MRSRLAGEDYYSKILNSAREPLRVGEDVRLDDLGRVLLELR